MFMNADYFYADYFWIGKGFRVAFKLCNPSLRANFIPACNQSLLFMIDQTKYTKTEIFL